MDHDERVERVRMARELDGRLKALARSARRAEAELAKALLEMKRRGLFRCLGYSHLRDYAEAELDLPGGRAKDLVELAEKLEQLPKLRAAFEAGDLTWTKARQAARAATTADEDEWLERANTLTSRALERVVAAARGERPLVRITIELTEEDAADLDEAVWRIREDRNEALPLGAAVAEACRRSLGPPIDRPGYQIVVHHCPKCEGASRDAAVGPIEVSPAELEAARADAEVIELRSDGRRTRRRTITPAERDAVIARDHGRCRL